MTAPALLDVRGLRVLRGTQTGVVTALDGVDVTVRPGETVAIVGESGSGKSSFADTVTGLVDPAVTRVEGSICFDGLDLRALTAEEWSRVRGSRLAMVFQDQATALNPVVKAGPQVTEAIAIHRPDVTRAEARTEVLDLFARVGIPRPEQSYDAYPHELSGGMRQRVMIAMAVVNKPALLMADEPTTALDVTTQAQVLDVLKRLQADTGMAIVFITHNLEVVSGFADRVVVMRRGKVVEHGPTAGIFGAPRQPYTRELLDAVPRVEPREPRPVPAGGTPPLEVKDLVRTFRSRRGRDVVTAVRQVSLDIAAGRTVGVVGESGSGKTTLARCVASLIARDSGTVRIDGYATRSRGRDRGLRARGSLQFVFQDPFESLDPTWTVRDVVAEPLRRHQMTRAERDRRVAQALESVGLTAGMADRKPREFSGGERQRISIARAVAVRPKLLILDEPTASLDVSIQAKVIGLLRAIQAEQQISFLFITHDLALAHNVCDHVAVMKDGAVVEYGDVGSVFSSPAHEYTKTLLAARPALVHGRLQPPYERPAGTSGPPARAPLCQKPDASSPERQPMFTSRKRALAALAGAGALVALSACHTNSAASAPANSSPASGGTAGTVTVATRNIAANLDPALQDDDPSYAYASAVYDTLVTYDDQTKKYVPDLATSWAATGGTVYTFQIRKGVTFHDGSSLTAAGVKDSLERTISIGQGYSYLLDGVASISAPSQDELVIKLKSPDPAFVGDLTQMFIASDKAIKAHPGKAGESWFASHDAGSGPYELTTYQPNSQIVVSQFKDYWRGWSGSHVKVYDFQVTDPATQVLDLRQGTADVADAVATQQLASLKSSGYSVTMNAGLPFYLSLNLSSPRLQNVDVRHAIALAVPYQEIIQKVMLGYASRLSGPAPSWMSPVNPAIKPTATDLATAAKLMRAAGYSTAHPLKLSMIYFNGLPIEQTIATIVQASLQSVGISLSVQPAPWATLTAEVENPATRPDIGEVAMSAVTPDIGPLLVASFDPSDQGSWQYWGYNDKPTVSLLDRAQGASSLTEQTSLYEQAEMNLVNQYAAVWLMTDPDVIVTSPALHNVQQNPAERAFDYYAAYKS